MDAGYVDLDDLAIVLRGAQEVSTPYAYETWVESPTGLMEICDILEVPVAFRLDTSCEGLDVRFFFGFRAIPDEGRILTVWKLECGLGS